MTGQDRYDALANVRLAVGLARAYLGVTTRLSRSVTPEEMDGMLAKAERDLSALTIEAAIGADVPRPEGTRITAEPALFVLDGGGHENRD